jgi:hypothetical protein
MAFIAPASYRGMCGNGDFLVLCCGQGVLAVFSGSTRNWLRGDPAQKLKGRSRPLVEVRGAVLVLGQPHYGTVPQICKGPRIHSTVSASMTAIEMHYVPHPQVEIEKCLRNRVPPRRLSEFWCETAGRWGGPA